MGQAKLCVELCKEFGETRKAGKMEKNKGKNVTQSPMCCRSDCVMKNFGFIKNGIFKGDMAKRSLMAMDKTKRWSNEVKLQISSSF